MLSSSLISVNFSSFEGFDWIYLLISGIFAKLIPEYIDISGSLKLGMFLILSGLILSAENAVNLAIESFI